MLGWPVQAVIFRAICSIQRSRGMKLGSAVTWLCTWAKMSLSDIDRSNGLPFGWATYQGVWQ